MSKANYKD